MISPADFLALIQGQYANQNESSMQVKLAKVDPAFNGTVGTTGARVTFEGESTLSGRGYMPLGSYFPERSDRVMLIHVGNSWVIMGGIATYPTVPVGTISMFGAVTPPDGYAACDGTSVLRSLYPALATLWAAETVPFPYGTVDGTHMNMPSFLDMFPRGNTPGATGGADTHELSVGELASHNHTQDSHNHTQNSHDHAQDAHNHTQDSHNHTQNSHDHAQDAHNHTQDSHNHNQDSHNHNQNAHDHPQGAHSHGINTYASGGTSTSDRVSFWSTSGAGTVTGSAATLAATADNGEAQATNQATTATNQAVTATNNDATANNQAATATNNAVTATNNDATANNQSTTATNNAVTATNQATGSGTAFSILPPYVGVHFIIKT